MGKGISLFFIKDEYINSDLVRKELDRASKFALGTEGCGIMELTEEFIRKIQAYTIKERVKTAFGQAENIRKNVKDGIKKARAEGKIFGGKSSKGQRILNTKEKNFKSIFKF